MARILIVDDDPSVLDSIGTLLASAGYDVMTASDGLEGLSKALQTHPDLVLIDLRLPVLDGFGFVAAFKANASTRKIPCLLITALDDRSSMRRAMGLGAEGMLIKPVRIGPLLETISRRLELASETHAQTITPSVVKQALERTPGWTVERELEAALEPSSTRAAIKEARHASVLYSDIRNFSRMAEMLPSSDMVDVLQGYYECASGIIRRQNGMLVRIIGDALLAAFESPAGGAEDHAGRAIRCGLLLAKAADSYGQGLEERYPRVQMPRFAVGTGIHTGEVMVCSMGPGRSSEVTVIGDTVNVAARLESRSKTLGCHVVASSISTDMADENFVQGKRELVALKGRHAPIEAVEILDFVPRSRDAHEPETMKS